MSPDRDDRPAAADSNVCPSCGAEGPAQGAFCPVCGAALRPEPPAEIARLIDRRTQEILAERLRDERLVEVEVLERVAERAVKWARLAGLVIGVPIALLAGFLSFLGIKTYSDLNEVSEKLEETGASVEQAHRDAEAAASGARSLLSQTEAIDADLERARAVSGRLEALEEELRAAEARLGQRQRQLESTVQKLIEGRVEIDTGDPELSALFSRYLPYLDAIGFPKSDQEIRVVVSDDPTFEHNAYYNPSSGEVVLGKAFATARSVALREYTHHVLFSETDRQPTARGHFSAIEAALADYFPSSFLDNPRVGADAELPGTSDYLRNLDNDLTRDDLERRVGEAAPGAPWYFSVAEVWGGLLWALREEIGQRVADRAALAAWRGLDGAAPDQDLVVAFARGLHEAAVSLAPESRSRVDRIWRSRRFPSGS